MFDSPLTWLMVLPLAGALVAPLGGRSGARAVALAVMLVVLEIAWRVFAGYDGSAAAAATHAVSAPLFPSLGVTLSFAVDGLNVYLLLLTALLFPVVLACAWPTGEARTRRFPSLLLAAQAVLLGTFLTQNLLVFFVLWEAVLVPMLFLILFFGGPRRRSAAVTFFLYTMAGGVLLLAGVILLGYEAARQTGQWSFDFDVLTQLQLSPGRQMFVFCAIALGCAIKSPLVPFHSWLPLAYGQASVPGTALMAGVMSKMGAYGFVKLALPLAPQAAIAMAPWMTALAALTIVYGAVLALRQHDPRQLVAYASLSHMGYIVLGVFAFQPVAAHGAMFQVLSHGLSVAGLFLMLGLIEQRCGPLQVGAGALAERTPRLAVVLMLFVLASLALPLSSGFTAEFMVLLGSFTQGLAAWRTGGGSALLAATLAACTGVVVGATYMLRFARQLLYAPPPGAPAGRAPAPLADLQLGEAIALAPLLALILWVGVWPAPLMGKVEAAAVRIAAPAPAVRAAPAAAPRTLAQGAEVLR